MEAQNITVDERGALRWGELPLPAVLGVSGLDQHVQVQMEQGLVMTVKLDGHCELVASLLRRQSPDAVRACLAGLAEPHAEAVLALLRSGEGALDMAVLSLNSGSYGSVGGSPAEYHSGYWGEHAGELWTACQQLGGSSRDELQDIFDGLGQHISEFSPLRAHLRSFAVSVQRQLFATGRAGLAQRWLTSERSPANYEQFCHSSADCLHYDYSVVAHANFAKGRSGLNPVPGERSVLRSGTCLVCTDGKIYTIQYLVRWTEKGHQEQQQYRTDLGDVTLLPDGEQTLRLLPREANCLVAKPPANAYARMWIVVDQDLPAAAPEGAEQPGYAVPADQDFLRALQHAFDRPILAQLAQLRQLPGLAQVLAQDTVPHRQAVLLEQIRTRQPAALCLQESDARADLGSACTLAEDGALACEVAGQRFAGVAARKCAVLLDEAQFVDIRRSPVDGMFPMDHVAVAACCGGRPVTVVSIHADSDSGPQLQQLRDEVRTQLLEAGLAEQLCVIAIDANLKQRVKAEVTQQQLEAAFAGVAAVAPHFRRHPEAWRTAVHGAQAAQPAAGPAGRQGRRLAAGRRSAGER